MPISIPFCGCSCSIFLSSLLLFFLRSWLTLTFCSPSPRPACRSLFKSRKSTPSLYLAGPLESQPAKRLRAPLAYLLTFTIHIHIHVHTTSILLHKHTLHPPLSASSLRIHCAFENLSSVTMKAFRCTDKKKVFFIQKGVKVSWWQKKSTIRRA